MRLVPFRPEHLRALTPPVADPDLLDRFARQYRATGPAWTAMSDGRPVGCGGILRTGDAGLGWVILSHPVRTLPVHRAACRVLDHELASGNTRHIQARALEEWDGACRWLERLGFHAVGRDGEFRVYER